MKIYLSTDIEGATGVVSFSQCSRPSSELFDFRWARRRLTEDVNAAIRGARSAGADEVVVIDGHAGRKNLLADDLEPGTQLISGIGSGNQGMMEGFDSSFDAALLIGYHAKAGAERGVMEHALAGGVHRFWMNDVEAGEIAVSAAVAGAYGRPVVFVCSDEEGCVEAQRDIPGVCTYATKIGLGRYMARVKHPCVTLPAIELSARDAVLGRDTIAPLVVAGPTTLRIQFRDTAEVDLATTLEDITRVDGYTLEVKRPTFLEAHRVAYAIFAMSIRGRQSEN